MRDKRNYLLIKILACAAKLATVPIPLEYICTACQDAIDMLADMVLDIPDEMPVPRKVLTESDEVIICAVEDLIAETNIFEDENLFVSSSDQLAKSIMQQSKVMEHHEEKNEYPVSVALKRYLGILKEWAVQQPKLLLSRLEFLGKQIKNQGKVFENHGDRINDLENWTIKADSQISQLADAVNSGSNSKDIPDLLLYDASTMGTEEDRNQFYRYFKADSSISVDSFFWCENYKLQIMSDESYDSHEPIGCDKSEYLDLNNIMAIISKQQLILITGLYGTGKTTLLKRLHYELKYKSACSAFYFHARDLLDVMEEIGFSKKTGQKPKINQKYMDQCFLNLSDKQQEIYILIDELDELNKAIYDTTYLDIFSVWLSKFLRIHQGFRIILSSRKYAQIGNETELCVADSLYYEYSLESGVPLYVICTEPFSPHTRNAWIEEYARLNKKCATYSNIKKDYGKIVKALSTPIFLYAFMQNYLSDTDTSDSIGYYNYYSRFVEKTVGGKYGIKHTKEDNVGISSGQYRAMLQKLAYRILQYSEEILTKEIQGTLFAEEQPLLADSLTKRKFEMPLMELDNSDIILDTRKYKTAYRINCFFLSMDKSRVYFTDTNILFALASEYVYKCIEKLAKKKEFQVADLTQIDLFHLYPHLVDYIVYLAKQPTYAEDIRAYINSFVRNPSIRSHFVDLSAQNKNWVEKILLLYIIFLKTNTDSYKTPDYQHILKEIIYYVNAYRTNFFLTDGGKYPYTIERYFMKLDLHQLDLRRINLKNFNFQGSTITGSCRFYQCKFDRTNFTNVVMEGSQFVLCEFKRIDNAEFNRKNKEKTVQAVFDTCEICQTEITAQSIVFRNCKIDGLILRIQGDQNAEFINCFIKKMTIIPKSDKASGKPIFKQCVLEKMPTVEKYSRDIIEGVLRAGKNIVMEK